MGEHEDDEATATDATALPDIGVLCDAAREAGEIALRYYGNAPKTWMKPGNSPVTEADLAIDRMLHRELRDAFPSFGWLSEEIEDDGSRLSGSPTFIVDPIDGTKGFMAGSDDWAVSIGLVHQGEPVRGVLFNPVRGEMMMASKGMGASVETADGTVSALTPSGREQLSGSLIAHPGRVFPSQPHRKAPRLASLALRIAAVASGRFDGCVASGGARDWDLAAADALIREAGLVMQTRDGSLPRYDRSSTAHAVLFCGTAGLCAAMAEFAPGR
ncbi:MAG: 3'(2'),5'-bisphosphate nucleotidase CysQ [Pseudomonadota bacterium]